MAAASFIHASGRVDFSRAPLRPDRTASLAQDDPESAGGVRFGADYYYANDLLPLNWGGMAEAEKIQLVEFYLARGVGEVFTYLDVAGNSLQVTFSGTSISVKEIAYGRFNVSLTLRVA